MKVVTTERQLREAVAALRRRGRKVGFVPTMGYLHEGHLSLVRASRRECRTAVVSVFVNPIQFGPKEDLKSYPRDPARDLKLLRRAGADVVYLPREKGFYPDGFQTSVRVRDLQRPWCGRTRPGHFDGVATVVSVLLHRVGPDAIYMGQKDYQQAVLVGRMIEDLSFPVRLRICPIVREKDGLAMSSRNVRLSARERAKAPLLYAALKRMREAAAGGQRRTARLRGIGLEVLEAIRPEGRLEYLEIGSAVTLEPMVELGPGGRAVAAVAARFGRTRLIDNLFLGG